MKTNLKPGLRSRSVTRWGALALFAALAIVVQASAQKLITFEAPEAGTGAGQGTLALGEASPGTIMGSYFDANGAAHGFLRDRDGKIATIDAPGAGAGAGQGTQAFGASLTGAITGWYVDAGGGAHGFLRDEYGAITTFDVPGAGSGSGQGTFSANINEAGTITGWYTDAGSVVHGFLRSLDGRLTTFDAPEAGTSAGQGTETTLYGGINWIGASTGNIIDASNVYYVYIRAPEGGFTTFEAPGAGTDPNQGTITEAINPIGPSTIIGYFVDGSGAWHGFIRDPDGKFTQVDAPGAGTGPGQGTLLSDLNPAGEIDGEIVDANNVSHALLRSPDGKMTTFEVPGAGKGTGQGTVGVTVTQWGEIIGVYIDSNSVWHSFLLTPR